MSSIDQRLLPFAKPFLPHEIDVHPDCARIRATIEEEIGKIPVPDEDDFFDEDWEAEYDEIAEKAQALIKKLEAHDGYADELRVLKACIK